MRRYGNSEKMTGMLQKVGMEEDEEISHPLLNRSIESAQKRVNNTITKSVVVLWNMTT